uniref:RING-type domain-containing protein n=1 Tax=Kalanchoe fedtschenkoi TaxID=63787 RepID=A0A7N0VK55_KALFE
MEMMYYQVGRVSYQDSLPVLESDIQHANALAAAIPTAKGGTRLQMKLVYNHMAPIILFFLQWLDCSCTCLLPQCFNLFHVLVYKVRSDEKAKISRYGRKATIKDFYSIILPSLQRLHGDFAFMENCSDKKLGVDFIGKKKLEHSFSRMDMEREDECGICLEPCTKMVLPNCCHSMCINCYRDWNMRSESCPFCRGSLKRVNSEDLWVLTAEDDVADTETVTREDLLRFYLYINTLPKDFPDALSLVY